MAREILVIKLGALGDFIQALGPMAAIRKAHVNDRITLLTTAPYAQLARECGYFDDIMIDTRPRWFDAAGWLKLRRTLNGKRFTRVYDLQNNDRTELYLRLFLPRPEWVGAAAGASHRNNSPERTSGKAFTGHVQTLALAGIHDVRIDKLDWMAGRQDYEGLSGAYVLIVPGASPKHPEKCWPASGFRLLCERLAVQGMQPVVIGGPAEAPLGDAILKDIPGALNLAGKTQIQDIAALARNAAGAIGNDTGPMHLIAPTGCPTIVLFSKKTNPLRHGPLGEKVVTIQKDRLDDLDADTVWEAFCAQQMLAP